MLPWKIAMSPTADAGAALKRGRVVLANERAGSAALRRTIATIEAPKCAAREHIFRMVDLLAGKDGFSALFTEACVDWTPTRLAAASGKPLSLGTGAPNGTSVHLEVGYPRRPLVSGDQRISRPDRVRSDHGCQRRLILTPLRQVHSA